MQQITQKKPTQTPSGYYQIELESSLPLRWKDIIESALSQLPSEWCSLNSSSPHVATQLIVQPGREFSVMVDTDQRHTVTVPHPHLIAADEAAQTDAEKERLSRFHQLIARINSLPDDPQKLREQLERMMATSDRRQLLEFIEGNPELNNGDVSADRNELTAVLVHEFTHLFKQREILGKIHSITNEARESYLNQISRLTSLILPACAVMIVGIGTFLLFDDSFDEDRQNYTVLATLLSCVIVLSTALVTIQNRLSTIPQQAVSNHFKIDYLHLMRSLEEEADRTLINQGNDQQLQSFSNSIKRHVVVMTLGCWTQGLYGQMMFLSRSWAKDRQSWAQRKMEANLKLIENMDPHTPLFERLKLTQDAMKTRTASD